MKDLFSKQANQYAAFRPVYPQQLFDYLYSLVSVPGYAWDAGTGNGQVAAVLARHFKKVFATDISHNQLEEAIQKDNIVYSKQASEHTDFADGMFNLVTAGQAAHWFDLDKFYSEVKRTTCRGGVLALFGYGLLETNDEANELIRHFYTDIVGSFWDTERHHIDEHYQGIPFPFNEVKAPPFKIECQWTLERVLGYLGTWSAVQHFRSRLGSDPVEVIREKLEAAWGRQPTKEFSFPVFCRIGVV